ncbi:hypothetical protein ACE41H_15395 [Paenibacillus enshidis]|uniref:CobQ/CobB/MinD/ParA nucleotide binding domain-containing protein n=1 Tax=Paenibacillus enshidis TaxID=1458439 RepID=A0ABV5AVW0_9BACL
MQRILMASADSAEQEWFTEEMKDARIVGKIQSLEFFIQQWQSVQADTCIVADNVAENEELLLSHVNWLQAQESSVTVVFIHLRDAEDEFISTLMNHNVICVHYDKLEPGTVESTLSAFTDGETEFQYSVEDKAPLQADSVPEDVVEFSPPDEPASVSQSQSDEAADSSDKEDVKHEEEVPGKTKLQEVLPFLAKRARKAGEQEAAAHEEGQAEEATKVEEVVEEPVPEAQDKPRKEVKPKKIKTSVPKKQEAPKAFALPATSGTYTIGVAGIRGRVGTTTISLQVAAFLVKQGLKVAICELPKNDPVFWKLGFDRNIPFKVEGIYLYPRCEDFIDIMYSNQYDVVILDVGSLLESNKLSQVAYEFVRLQKKILTSTPGMWDMDKLMDTIQLLQEKNFLSKTDIIVNPSEGNVSAVSEILTKKFCAELDIRLFHSGIIPDPFKAQADSIINEILRGDHT